MAHHLLSKEARESRDEKILKMARMGCSYADIARRYGLARGTISKLLKRRYHEACVTDNFRSTGDWNRCCFGDGISG